MARLHPPAMVEEVLSHLGCRERPDGTFVDCTTGTGGHSLAILEAAPQARLICLDRDARSLEVAKERLYAYRHRVQFRQGDYRQLPEHLENLGITEVDGCLIDAGMSLWQVDDPERGFSFRVAGPLDMRYDQSQPLTAADLVNRLSQVELADLIRHFTDERWARKIAAAIVAQRPITDTVTLAHIVAAAVPAPRRPQKRHPATKTFAALRAAVNEELDALRNGVLVAAKVLAVGGRLVVLTYSSHEDRTVKQTFRTLADFGGLKPRPEVPSHDSVPPLALFRILTKKPLVPSASEARQNPRARSAKLRALERLR
ncbi:MAG: 16S rRNA (cytosine(1402)-N(4))-methyltransferase RsmH [Abditibacteriales bacterium]|nr:16S rRNA (cytosine(1402)-N(4))-methyltransferase RsmH [Abditibacteriales bacterium]MDW8366527.1 16S rRNA (cytosine(1402)-N(4))-methyltransferase RsmH [Abditibacteriales bacterium]